ncbi:MAG: UpxY family transcription antiterminator [Chitinophagaceae bacterium]
MKIHSPGNWHVLYTRSKNEKKIAESLQREKIENYLPLRNVVTTVRNRKVKRSLPLFPSYLFVKINSSQEYLVTLNCLGALYFLKSDGKVYSMDSSIIEDIKTITGESESFEVLHGLPKGQKVRITGGAFEGLTGELVDFKGEKKVCVSVKVIERALLVTICPSLIQIIH